MQDIFKTLKKCEENLLKQLTDTGTPVPDHHEWPWRNFVFESKFYRRAHLDAVETDKLYMFHLCIFPQVYNPAPIYGVDVIAGKNKMTGAFHDFSASSGGEDHPLGEWFENEVKDFIPSKRRELPQWALNIFTDSFIAAGNVKTDEEATAIIDLAVNNLKVYFESIGEYTGMGEREMTIASQNYYCENQQQNPHTPRVMTSLGLNEADVQKFCTDMLFPKIV